MQTSDPQLGRNRAASEPGCSPVPIPWGEGQPESPQGRDTSGLKTQGQVGSGLSSGGRKAPK